MTDVKAKAKAKVESPVFPFNSLSCTQTPFQFPKTLKVGDLPEYKSEIRIMGATAGPGRVLERASKDGQLVEENSQISLLFEGQTFNISDTVLHFPGMHRPPATENPPVGEIHVYFRNHKPAKRLQQVRDDLCVVIPIKIGTGKGVDYFAYLNRDAGLRSEYLPALLSVLTDKTPVILYKGKDLKNRGYGLPNPDTQCLPESYAIQFIFLQNPIFIRAKDVERLKTANKYIEQEPPSDPVNIVDLRRFCAIQSSPGLRVGSSSASPNDLPDGVKRMDSMKCRPLDPKKDIRGDKIVVNEKARNVYLPDELYGKKRVDEEGGANMPGPTTSDSSLQPGDFEDLLALPIGFAIGLFLTGCIMWGLLGIVYRGGYAAAAVAGAGIAARRNSFNDPLARPLDYRNILRQQEENARRAAANNGSFDAL
jgi:hypothetical protein